MTAARRISPLPPREAMLAFVEALARANAARDHAAAIEDSHRADRHLRQIQ